MRIYTKIILGVIAAAIMTVLGLFITPSTPAQAAGWCGDTNGWNKLDKVSSWDYGPYYRGDTITSGVTVRGERWSDGRGYYTVRPAIRTATGTYFGTATMNNAGTYSFTSTVLIYSYRNNNTLSSSCYARITWNEYVAKIEPITPTVTVSYSGTGFHDTTRMNVSVSNSASGAVRFRLNNQAMSINVTNGFGSGILPWRDTYFKARSAAWDSYSGMNFRQQFGTNSLLEGNFVPSDTRVFNAASFSLPQLVIGEESGNGTVGAGSNPPLNGLSRSGWSNVTCNPLCSFSSGGGAANKATWQNVFNPSAGGTQRFGNDNATKTKTTIVPMRNYFTGDSTGGQTASFPQGIIYCYPESTSVSVAFWDYGQALYDETQYTKVMSLNRQYYYNMGPMRNSNRGEGFVNLLTTAGGPSASDGWDAIVPRPNGGINWGGGWRCNYPFSSPWITPSIDFNLKYGELSNEMRQGVNQLRVVKPGDPARSIQANNIQIIVNGTVSRTINCTTNGAGLNCPNFNLSTLPAGNYSIYARWGGDGIIFRAAQSPVKTFTVYQVFECVFDNNNPAKSIRISDKTTPSSPTWNLLPNSNLTVARGQNENTVFKVDMPAISRGDIRGVISWDSPPAGYPNILSMIGLSSDSDPRELEEVKMFMNANGTSELQRPAWMPPLPTNSNDPRSNWSEYDPFNYWNNSGEKVNGESAWTRYMSVFWPSSIDADGRNSLQLKEAVQVYGTAFDRGATEKRTGWHSCSGSDVPESGRITVISGQLKE